MKRGASGIFSIKIEPDKSRKGVRKMIEEGDADPLRFFYILYGGSCASIQSPLYGRRTAQMKIPPFSFEETCHYLTKMSDEDKALMYGVVGGTPQYLLKISDKLSVEDNIKHLSELHVVPL